MVVTGNCYDNKQNVIGKNMLTKKSDMRNDNMICKIMEEKELVFWGLYLIYS